MRIFLAALLCALIGAAQAQDSACRTLEGLQEDGASRGWGMAHYLAGEAAQALLQQLPPDIRDEASEVEGVAIFTDGQEVMLFGIAGGCARWRLRLQRPGSAI